MAVGYLSVTLPWSMASSQKPGGSGGASGSHQGRACSCCGHQLSFLFFIKNLGNLFCSLTHSFARYYLQRTESLSKNCCHMFILIETLVGMFHMSMQYTYFAYLSRNKAHRQYLKKRSPLALLLQDVPQVKTSYTSYTSSTFSLIQFNSTLSV